MSSTDIMQRFIFDKTDIRGELVSLQSSYSEILNYNVLPSVIQTLLGEFIAAVSLLTSNLKFEGRITLQARGDGPLPLIMAECTHLKALRAVARPDDDVDWAALETATFTQLIGKGMLVIIIEPAQGQRYQGVVPLDADDLAGCLEHYFDQSEQLPTRLWLAADSQSKTAGGLFLQAMPASSLNSSLNSSLSSLSKTQEQSNPCKSNQDRWETVTTLAATVKNEELLTLPHEQLLYRLFHEEKVRLFDSVELHFQCSCSFERSGKALISLGHKEVQDMLKAQGEINIDCQFCNQHYSFSEKQVAILFPGNNLH